MIGIGGDFGLVRDASAFCAVGHAKNQYIVRELLELRPSRGAPLKLSIVCAEAAEFARRHGERAILVDHHLLEAAKEHMPEGTWLVATEGGQQAKVDTYTFAKDCFASGLVRIPGCYTRLKQQLRDVMSKPTSGGGLTISSPRRGGAHGDLVSAFVLALWRAKLSTPADLVTDAEILGEAFDGTFRTDGTYGFG